MDRPTFREILSRMQRFLNTYAEPAVPYSAFVSRAHALTHSMSLSATGKDPRSMDRDRKQEKERADKERESRERTRDMLAAARAQSPMAASFALGMGTPFVGSTVPSTGDSSAAALPSVLASVSASVGVSATTPGFSDGTAMNGHAQAPATTSPTSTSPYDASLQSKDF